MLSKFKVTISLICVLFLAAAVGGCSSSSQAPQPPTAPMPKPPTEDSQTPKSSPTLKEYPAPSTYYRMDNTHEVAVRPDGKELYVYGVESSIILIVDIDSPDYPVVGKIELPGRVAGGTPYISFSSDGKRAYICRAIQREYEGTRYKGESLAKIIAIDTENKEIVSEIEVPEPLLPAIGSVIPSADGRKLYFTALDPSSHETGIGRLDMDNETLVDFLPLESVNFITLSNDGKYIYATQGLKAFGPSKDLFTVIDAGSLEVVSSLPIGSGPQYVAITPDGQKAYVANQGSNDVSVIDLKTLAVTKNVDVGPEPRAIAITPDGKKAYVGLPGSATGMRGYGPGKMVAVLDVETDALLGTIEVDLEPMSVAMDPDGTKVYVSDGNANGLNPAEVHIIDAVNDAYLRPIILRRAASYTPTAIDVTPDGQMLFVVSEATDNLLVISTEGGEIIAKLNIRPRGVKVSADGSRAYVYNPEKLLIIEAGTLEIIKSIDVSGIYPEFFGDQEAFKIVLTTDEDTAYLLGRGAEVIVVDLVKGKVTDTIPFAEQPIEHSRGLALTPDETKLLVSDYHSRTVAVIDTSTRAVIARLPVANLPSEIEISQDGKRAYVLQQHTTTLMTIINLESLSILESIQFPAHIAASLDFELSQDGRYAYIACFDPNLVMVYDLDEEEAVEVIDVGLDPFNMASTPDRQLIYITNFTTDDISVVDAERNAVTKIIELKESAE